MRKLSITFLILVTGCLWVTNVFETPHLLTHKHLYLGLALEVMTLAWTAYTGYRIWERFQIRKWFRDNFDL